MNPRIIGALVAKDFALYFRNRFFAVITILGLVFYVLVYFLMPQSVDERLEIGLYAPELPPSFEQAQGQGLRFELTGSEQLIKDAVIEGQFLAGVVLPPDYLDAVVAGRAPKVSIYFASDAPEEVKDAVQVLIRELTYLQTGQAPAFRVSEVVLGPDLVGIQIPPRDRLRPLLAVFLIMTETFGLATLITEEVQRRTITALRVTPMTALDLFTAKGIIGTCLAFGQGALFMAVVGGMQTQPLVVIVALLAGAIMVTGIGFLIASLAKDMMSVLAWGVLAFMIFSIPAVSVLFPGTLTGWVKAIPSFYLVDTVYRAANFDSGWGDLWYNLTLFLAFNVVIVWAGVIALRRRFR